MGITLTNDYANGVINVKVDVLGDIGQPNIYREINRMGQINTFAFDFKKSTDTEWGTFMGSPSLNEEYGFVPRFSFDFPFCGNNITYDFRLRVGNYNPLRNHNQGDASAALAIFTAQIKSSFCKSYICDGKQMYNLVYDWSVDTSAKSNPNELCLPFNSQFPVYAKLSRQNAIRAQYTALLLSNNSALIDRPSQVNLKNRFEGWLSNGNPKIIKTLNGEVYLAYINDAISSNYYKELGNGIASSAFSWIECGDACTGISESSLRNNIDISYDYTALSFTLNQDNLSYSVSGVDDSSIVTSYYTNIVIPPFYNGLPVTTISDSAFYASTHYRLSAQSIYISKNIISIGQEAFYELGISTLLFEGNGSLSSLGSRAFGSSHLTSLRLPNTISSMDTEAIVSDNDISLYIYDLYSFMSISGDSNIYSSFTRLYVDDITNIYYFDEVTELNIPNHIITIPTRKFYNYKDITSVIFPSSIKMIKTYAFFNEGATQSLTSATFATQSGWYTTNNPNSTSGTAIDVTSASANAINLNTVWCDFYIKHN